MVNYKQFRGLADDLPWPRRKDLTPIAWHVSLGLLAAAGIVVSVFLFTNPLGLTIAGTIAVCAAAVTISVVAWPLLKGAAIFTVKAVATVLAPIVDGVLAPFKFIKNFISNQRLQMQPKVAEERVPREAQTRMLKLHEEQASPLICVIKNTENMSFYYPANVENLSQNDSHELVQAIASDIFVQKNQSTDFHYKIRLPPVKDRKRKDGKNETFTQAVFNAVTELEQSLINKHDNPPTSQSLFQSNNHRHAIANSHGDEQELKHLSNLEKSVNVVADKERYVVEVPKVRDMSKKKREDLVQAVALDFFLKKKTSGAVRCAIRFSVKDTEENKNFSTNVFDKVNEMLRSMSLTKEENMANDVISAAEKQSSPSSQSNAHKPAITHSYNKEKENRTQSTSGDNPSPPQLKIKP